MYVEIFTGFSLKWLFQEGIPSIRRPFGLVVETNSKQPFLDKEPMEVMRSGNFHPVPLIIGYTSSEGMIFEFHRDPNQDMLPIEDVIPWFYHCEVGTPKTRTLVDKIKNFYFEGEDYSDKFLSKKYDVSTAVLECSGFGFSCFQIVSLCMGFTSR